MIDNLEDKCVQKLLVKIDSSYRVDDRLPGKTSKDVFNYYSIMNKKAMAALKNEDDPVSMHQYLWSKYIKDFKPLLMDKEKCKAIFRLFEMIDELILIYKIDVDEELRVWADV